MMLRSLWYTIIKVSLKRLMIYRSAREANSACLFSGEY